jgi:hypothetical protein
MPDHGVGNHRDRAGVLVELKPDSRGHQRMGDVLPADAPRQDPVSPHQLDERLLALQPQPQVIELLVQPARR